MHQGLPSAREHPHQPPKHGLTRLRLTQPMAAGGGGGRARGGGLSRQSGMCKTLLRHTIKVTVEAGESLAAQRCDDMHIRISPKEDYYTEGPDQDDALTVEARAVEVRVEQAGSGCVSRLASSHFASSMHWWLQQTCEC